MRMVYRSWLAAWTLLSAGLAGQNVDYRGERPTQPEKDKFGSPVPVYVCVPVADVRLQPSTSAAVCARPTYLSLYYKAREDSSGRAPFYLIGTLDQDREQFTAIVGWISDADCVVGTQALKTKQSVCRKALVINRWQAAKRGEGSLQSAPVYEGPSDRAKKVAELGLFSFYYIWKQASAQPDGDEYWLLGGRPYIERVTEPRESILGWVSGARLLEWDSRQAVEFKKDNLAERTEPVRIFGSDAELQSWLVGGGKGAEPLATEDLSVKAWLPHWTRFPLLESKPWPADAAVSLCRVGYVGDEIALASGASMGNATAVDDRRQKLENLRKMARAVDIVLVMDATGSMGQFMTPVANAVKRTLEQVTKTYGDNKDLMFSVVFYRDYYDEPAGLLVKQKELTDKAEEVVRYINDEPVRPGQGANPNNPAELTEAVFYAVCYALENTKFRECSVRQVVVIGDRGNHARDSRGYTEQKVVDALVKADASLVALHTESAQHQEKDDAARLFRAQFETIIAGIKQGSGGACAGAYFCQPTQDEVANEMITRCDEAVAVSKRVQDGLATIAHGANLKLVETQHGVQISARITNMMKEVGLDPEDFRQSGAQICETGWLANRNPRSGRAQVDTVLLVEKVELNNLFNALGRLLQKPQRERVGDQWKKVLEDELGEECPAGVPVNEYLTKVTGLPVRTKMLGYDLREIGRLDGRRYDELLEQLRKDCQALKAILWPEDEKASRWFKHDQIDYAWISRELLP